jgi:hypothetical protein
LTEIHSGANAAGKHLKGGAKPPSSLQEAVNRAYAAEQQDEFPSGLLMLIPNILLVTKSSLDYIEEYLAKSGKKM